MFLLDHIEKRFNFKEKNWIKLIKVYKKDLYYNKYYLRP